MGEASSRTSSPATRVLHRLCRVVAGRGRSQPVRAGTEMPAPAGNSGCSRPCRLRLYRSVTPEVAGSSLVALVKVPAKWHVVLSVQTQDRGRPHSFRQVTSKTVKTGRKPIRGWRFQAEFARADADHESGVRPDEMAGGHGPANPSLTGEGRTPPARQEHVEAVVSAAADAEVVVVGPCRRFPEPAAFTALASLNEGAQGCGAAGGRLPRRSGGSGEASEVPARRQAGAALRSSSSFGLTCASMARFFLRS